MALAARYLGRSALSVARRCPIVFPVRSFSVSPSSFLPDPHSEDVPPMPEYSPDLLTKEERSMYDMMSPEEQAEFDAENRRMVEEFNDPQKRAAKLAEIDRSVAELDRDGFRFEDVREKRAGFWADGEEDEFGMVEDADDEFRDDDITSMAHAELEVHREIREYARIAAWDMPLLSSKNPLLKFPLNYTNLRSPELAKPFTLPPETHILRFRYTSYMGEEHPAESKVVVEVSSKDLTPKYLSEAQRQTFLKLVGPRYNPETDIVRMSCEKFTTPAQNKRYLGDLVETLIKEAKEGDSFSDIPLDLRHHKPQRKLRFPESWNMTEERKKQLEARRAERRRSEQEGKDVVDGKSVVAQAIQNLPSLNPALNAKATQEREKVAARIAGKPQKRRVR
ncbi:hypothetical protein EYZ11_010101 [Aspergillus tanneri]|uniref:37S ribosomal protein S24, mitochondrial n=1 Tax=Aspergillus tanneri TaxID=1220188 RepID=A0A4S3J6P9_9EURO|nr:37S ribosomal protein S24, mitochondrial [Aspergillus tanneri]KAA8649846.1 37S ribosomal protein S24, mitochondrial [Aspergillus tanneri]THC90442.1 hypothetical protein EYZ11_010101 [Aspergillus tanneri]